MLCINQKKVANPESLITLFNIPCRPAFGNPHLVASQSWGYRNRGGISSEDSKWMSITFSPACKLGALSLSSRERPIHLQSFIFGFYYFGSQQLLTETTSSVFPKLPESLASAIWLRLTYDLPRNAQFMLSTIFIFTLYNHSIQAKSHTGDGHSRLRIQMIPKSNTCYILFSPIKLFASVEMFLKSPMKGLFVL